MGISARSTMLAMGLVVSMGAVANAAGCGGGDSSPAGGPDASAGITAGTLRGVLAGPNGESGVIDLTIPTLPTTKSARILSPVTTLIVSGTLRLSTVFGPIALTGTIHLDTGTIDFTGMVGGYTFHGTLANGVFTGTYTGPGGMGNVILTYDQLGGLRVFCGAFQSHLGRPGTPEQGVWDMFAVGTTVGVVYSVSSGAQGAYIGTATGSHVDAPSPAWSAVGDIDATGSFTGTWSDTTSGGDLHASEGTCRAFGTGSGDGGVSDAGDAASDAGTDSSTMDASADGGACTNLAVFGPQSVTGVGGSAPTETGAPNGFANDGTYQLNGNILEYGPFVSATTGQIWVKLTTNGSNWTFERHEQWFGSQLPEQLYNQTLAWSAGATTFTLSGGCPGGAAVTVSFTVTKNGAGAGKDILELLWVQPSAPGTTFREIYFQR